jgi:hypothetical protein
LAWRLAFATQKAYEIGLLGDKKVVVISVDATPNPNALKFTVGKPVGGPTTYLHAQPTDDPLGQELLALIGVTSIFLTADFVTLSKSTDIDWIDIVPNALVILEDHFG